MLYADLPQVDSHIMGIPLTEGLEANLTYIADPQFYVLGTYEASS